MGMCCYPNIMWLTRYAWLIVNICMYTAFIGYVILGTEQSIELMDELFIP